MCAHLGMPVIVAVWLLLSFASEAGAAESAVVNLAPRSGPSRFVSGADGKPAQIGVAPPEQAGSESSVVTIVPAPQIVVEPQSQSDESSSDSKTETGADSAQKDDTYQDTDGDSEKSEDGKPEEGGDADQPDDTAKAAADGACEPHCDGG